LNDEAALAVLNRVRGMGVQVRLGRGVAALTGTERVTGLVLDDGSELPCDLVVIATGLIPNTWLAFQCGLSVERGIAVDGQLRSIDDRRVYALGECAQPRGKLYYQAEVICQQARALAEQLLANDPTASLALTMTRDREAGGHQSQAS
jgi:nitrite reductase (NADH) large subunit